MGAINFDNIVISYPPADLKIEERLRNPGYPAQDQDVSMRCLVEDLNPAAPTVNRRVKVWYQWLPLADNQPLPGTNNWSSAAMLPLGGDLYEGTIPRFPNGYVHYYYECLSDGFFFARDPDGTEGAEGEHSESRLQKFWWNGTNQTARPSGAVLHETRYEVRRYRSEYGTVMLDAQPEAATVAMELVDDEVWQGVTLVTGITNLTFKFKGLDRYTNDAAFFSPTPVVWGDNDQDFPYPPVAGYLELDATNSIRAELEYSGFLLMRFNADNNATNAYIVKRAVYQNFNTWQASKVYFEESQGLYGIQSFPEDFNAWTTDAYLAGSDLGEPFQNETPSDEFKVYPFMTANNWVMANGRIVDERHKLQADPVNLALLLRQAGYVRNSGGSLTEGVEKMTYQARASIDESLAELRFALYNGGYSWTLPQTITTTFRAVEMSPAKPYISVLAGFQPFSQGSSCYEIRLAQVSQTTTGSDNTLQAQIWRWDPDTETSTQLAAGTPFTGSNLAVDKLLTIGITNVSGSTVIGVNVAGTQRARFSDSAANRLTLGGTVGFATHDALPSIQSVAVAHGGGSFTQNAATFATTTGWYMGGKRDDDNTKYRWSVEDNRLIRAVPLQTIDLFYAARRGEATAPDVADYVLKHAAVPVTSLNYGALREEILHLWDQSFVEIRYGGGDVGVVIDDPRIYPWRATSRVFEEHATDYYDWPDWNAQYDWLRDENPAQWAVLEGWIAPSSVSSGNEVQLDRSRANPALAQAVLSPLLTNGIGTINYSYRVTGGTAVYAIERSDDGLPRAWTTIEVHTNAAGESGSYYLPIRENFSGRIRIRLDEASDDDAVLLLDGLLARDYPPRDDTTWQAYNVLITDLQTNRLFEIQSCYLNNDPTNGVAGTDSFTEHEPFVQSPMVGTGIGEIGFWYRVFTPGNTGHITLAVASHPDTPDADWRVITNLTVTNSTYLYFNDPKIYDLDNKVLRVYSSTEADERVCIDNVVMTEPVRAGFEIRSVTLLPAQPLEHDAVQVEVEIGRFIMNPVGIEIYLSYHEGETPWGVTNWWSADDTGESERIRLWPVAEGSRIYRTLEGDKIPAFAVDTPVQYFAWGTHSDIKLSQGDRPIFQGTNVFTHPAWYWPVNLNETHAAEGWSPYYFVYSCPPYSVWVNEVNYYARYTDEDYEYIELLGPAQALINNWRIELIDYSTYDIYDTCIVSNNYRLPHAQQGWGFFLWGDTGVSNAVQNFDFPLQNNIQQSGGIVLKRSMGAIEHMICHGPAGASMIAAGFEYIGTKIGLTRYAPLHLYSPYAAGSVYEDFAWQQPSSWSYTPGEVNVDQTLADISTFCLISSFIGPHGTQDGGAGSPLNIQVAIGGSTQIVYTADQWYRIYSLKSNGTPVPEAQGASEYVWSVTGASQDISNEVAFAAWAHPYGGVPTAWLARWSEAAVAAGDTDGLDTVAEHLLNTSPTANTAYAFEVTSISVSNNVAVTVRLTRDTVVDDYNAGCINGKLYLYGSGNLLTEPFTEISVPPTEIDGADFGNDAGVSEHTYFIPVAPDPLMYYRAVIK